MDDFQSKIAAGMVVELFKEAIKGAQHLSNLIGGKLKVSDPLGTAARLYIDSCERRHNSIRIFGMSRSIPLDRVYTSVRVLSQVQKTEFRSLDNLFQTS